MSSELSTSHRFVDLLSEPLRNGIYKSKEHHGRGVKVVNMGELFGHPRLRDVPMKKLELTEAELRKSSLKEGDLLFARRSLVAEGAGKCSIVKKIAEATTFESSIIRARPNVSLADSDYLYYFFASPQGRELMGTILRQVAVSGITGSDLAELQIPLPPLREQCGRASVLEALDDRITLLRETNATLEAIAQALFKSWFVDFDPVRAKMEGRTPEGMDEATAALFPDGFETSELGEVPRGWRVGCIDDICSTVTNGGTPSRSKTEYWDQGTIPWFKTGEFHDGFLLQPSERITNAALIGSSVKLLPKDAVLMAIYAAPTVGRLGILAEPATFNQACTGMVARNEVGPWFLFGTLFNGRDWFNSRANGAAQQNISKAIVSAYRTVIPPNPVLDSFNLVASGIHEAIRMNTEKAMTLSTLRDTLLPRLISGQLRLPEAHATTESALGGPLQA